VVGAHRPPAQQITLTVAAGGCLVADPAAELGGSAGNDSLRAGILHAARMPDLPGPEPPKG